MANDREAFERRCSAEMLDVSKDQYGGYTHPETQERWQASRIAPADVVERVAQALFNHHNPYAPWEIQPKETHDHWKAEALKAMDAEPVVSAPQPISELPKANSGYAFDKEDSLKPALSEEEARELFIQVEQAVIREMSEQASDAIGPFDRFRIARAAYVVLKPFLTGKGEQLSNSIRDELYTIAVELEFMGSAEEEIAGRIRALLDATPKDEPATDKLQKVDEVILHGGYTDDPWQVRIGKNFYRTSRVELFALVKPMFEEAEHETDDDLYDCGEDTCVDLNCEVHHD